MTKKELNAIITAEFRRFDISKVKMASDFEYNYNKNIITYTLDMTSDSDMLFSKFLATRFDFEDKHPFIMSLLHEVGHAKNNDDIDGDVYAFCLAEKYKIAKEIEDTEDLDSERYENLLNRYFNLPDEIMATTWAVNYATSHKKQVKEMRKRIDKAINEYLITN